MKKIKSISKVMFTGMIVLSSCMQTVYADEIEPVAESADTIPAENQNTVENEVTEPETPAVSEPGASNPEENPNPDPNPDTSEPTQPDVPEQPGENTDSSNTDKDNEQNPGETDDKNQEKFPDSSENPSESVDNKDENSSEDTSKDTNNEKPVQEEPSNKSIKIESPVTAVVTTDTVQYKTSSIENNLPSLGYTGQVKNAIKLDHFITSNWNSFTIASNPFQKGQCTYFAWSRFYQVYGYDSGARGNGKTNAAEVVRAHSDKFKLSSTPAAGAVFSYERNSLMPQYGHVGFVEAYDAETDTIYISEGNVYINGTSGNIYIHKMKFSDLKKMYPDIVFAVPNQPVQPVKKIKVKTKMKAKNKLSKHEIALLKKATLKRTLKL